MRHIKVQPLFPLPQPVAVSTTAAPVPCEQGIDPHLVASAAPATYCCPYPPRRQRISQHTAQVSAKTKMDVAMFAVNKEISQ
ncbi:unnamed protein product [Urochloa humidicola]